VPIPLAITPAGSVWWKMRTSIGRFTKAALYGSVRDLERIYLCWMEYRPNCRRLLPLNFTGRSSLGSQCDAAKKGYCFLWSTRCATPQLFWAAHAAAPLHVSTPGNFLFTHPSLPMLLP
jgi:hypothetical protein